MGLNISKGDMYAFVSHTFNTVKGKCSHDCSYCFMKQYGEQRAVRLDQKEFETDLGSDNFIFVGSSCDMFADDIPDNWIIETLEYCATFKNKYLFQTKNPLRFHKFLQHIPFNSILGITLETNRIWPEMGKTPSPNDRVEALCEINMKRMVTVEPIMEFNLLALFQMIMACKPEWVVIGADSKEHKLPEPEHEKVAALIMALEVQGVEVKIKRNILRLGPVKNGADTVR